jgi:hypothetical protein
LFGDNGRGNVCPLDGKNVEVITRKEMAEVVQFDGSEGQPETPLTPELKQFIDRVIVPILIEHYLEELDGRDDLAGDSSGVRESHDKPAA